MNIKIAGKWMFMSPKMVLIAPMKNGDVPFRYVFYNEKVSNELLATHCHG